MLKRRDGARVHVNGVYTELELAVALLYQVLDWTLAGTVRSIHGKSI